MMSTIPFDMAQFDAPARLLSDEPTVELLLKAREGNRDAVEALLERCLPRLKRWAHGKLPAAARGRLDTGDIVQETVLHVLQNLDRFVPRHVGAMQSYLRQSVINRIRDEVRRVNRWGLPVELPEDLESNWTTPLEEAISAESYDRYRTALAGLGAKDQDLVLARLESQWTGSEIMERFRFPTVDAARMAVTRAVRRLTERLKGDSGPL
jgi:RNA polymerase sigma factor (sigma-70 family)